MVAMELLFLLAVFGLSTADEDVDKTLFGTKTAYDWIVAPSSILDNADMFVKYKGRDCTAVHVSMVFRHGYRLPGSRDVAEMNRLTQKLLETKQSSKEFDFLNTWKLNLGGLPGMLNKAGRQEMFDLGSRTALRFQLLFSNAKNRMELISTNMNRTIESAINFAHGFARHDVIDVGNVADPTETELQSVSVNDTLLRIYQSCSHYESVVASQAIKTRREAFTSSPSFHKLLRRIEEKLGFENDTHITKNDIKLMWEFCALDMLTGVENRWCSAMDNNDRKIMEYVGDLEYYFDYSYGNGVSGDIHCVVLRKLFKLMDDAIAGHSTGSDSYVIGSFMFGHSGTVLGTLSALGLFKDDPPITGTSMNDGRLFKIGRIAPMSGNVGFALYACGDKSETADSTQFAVRLFFNERELQIPQFHSLIVWYDDLKRTFADALKCDVNALCQRDASSRASGNTGKVFTTSFIVLFAVDIFWASLL